MRPLHASVCHFDRLLGPANDPHEVVVVIDVLRATTSIVCALAHGAREIVPVADPATAREIAAVTDHAFLAGESGNRKIPGFDIGNSPSEYDDRLSGKNLIMVTTNGTRALAGLREAPTVWCAALANISTVAQALAASAASAATIVCSGQMGAFSLEDFVCAGALVAKLHEIRPISCDDESMAARELYYGHREKLSDLIRCGNHAKSLAKSGFASDIEFCSVVDRHAILPTMHAGRIVAKPAALG
jgi:2-phosphosulfolactate phosphatase